MSESEWNWPLIIIFGIFFSVAIAVMIIPVHNVITTEICITIGETTRCTIEETFK